MQLGFIGLGHMGNPMVRNLLKAGFKVKVYDVIPDAVQSLVSQDAIAASSIADVAKDSDVVFTMLQTGQQVKDTCLQENGLYANLKKGAMHIDSSSIEISITRELHRIAEQKELAALDAPVSGGTAGAEAATLTFMVGGKEENFKKAYPILEKMGKKIVHAGAAGSGQAAKICNNLILGISMIAVSEGFNLGKKLGLDSKKFFEISSSASGQCWSMTSYCPEPGIIEKAPSNNEYRPGFMTKMMLKDLRLAENAAADVGAYLPLGIEAIGLYQAYADQGGEEKDFSGVINLIAEGE